MKILEKYKDVFIVALDVIAVNAAYFFALIIRYYVNAEYNPLATDVYERFSIFAPIYSILCVVIFYLFHLYGGIWKYAGLNDMNRILMANVFAAAVYFVGTLVIFGHRMPYSICLIGASLQFLFVACIRFSYRIYLVEKHKVLSRHQKKWSVMIIGDGEAARNVARQLESNEEQGWRPTVFVGSGSGRMLNGIPVIREDELEEGIDRYGVKVILIANITIKPEMRKRLQDLSDEKNIECLDYSGYLANLSGYVPLIPLLELVEGAVTLVIDGREKAYSRTEDAILDLKGRYSVSRIKGDRLSIILRKDGTEENWVQEYKEETGEEVSFF